MSREVSIGLRRFYIVSEPVDDGWRARVLERLDDKGSTEDMGIAAVGETRTVADERAFGTLQNRLRDAGT